MASCAVAQGRGMFSVDLRIMSATKRYNATRESYSQDAHELVLDNDEDQDLDERGGATSSHGGGKLDQTLVLTLLASTRSVGGVVGAAVRHGGSCVNLSRLSE